MRKAILLCALLTCLSAVFVHASAAPFRFGTAVRPDGRTLEVDGTGLLLDGHYILPVMGEIHFTRVPEQDWERELLKMKAGGINIAACYVFWNHHEASEGVFDWSGGHDLRRFLETARACGLDVVLRVGPFCHGEVYLGGIPEWIVDKAAADPEHYALRTTAPGFLEAVRRLYGQVGEQARGLLWKDGGPVIGVQVDNESSGPWPYLTALKPALRWSSRRSVLPALRGPFHWASRAWRSSLPKRTSMLRPPGRFRSRREWIRKMISWRSAMRATWPAYMRTAAWWRITSGMAGRCWSASQT